ncbi:hypothetical protein D1610_02240 [Sphingomonas gilva]|uniref:Uncharacterized protein n=1 Tax=Sphingomonas gilva TaxID=2305907 RepID=A0A396S6D6_9SPHN|nr:hypothetical protein [Sphingomonas gilva]RHW18975.1 hypothetical protein D1610_02240 [Sphingomonas gilva]
MNHAGQAENSAGQAVAVDGVVVLDGPDGVAVTLSPDAAEQTGRNLISAAEEARRQSGDA